MFTVSPNGNNRSHLSFQGEICFFAETFLLCTIEVYLWRDDFKISCFSARLIDRKFSKVINITVTEGYFKNGPVLISGCLGNE